MLAYNTLAANIMIRPPSRSLITPNAHLFSRVIHPYNVEAFERLLAKHDLASLYPYLCQYLRDGFPIGRMPDLQRTVIIPNNPSCFTYPSAVDDYLCDEVAAGRMSGPFPKEEIERILRGPFQSSPLIVAVQTQAPGTPEKLRICRHLSKGTKLHPSVNSFISKEDFPTRFDTAARVAEMVSLFPLLDTIIYTAATS